MKLFTNKKHRNIEPDELSTRIDEILEEYRPELIAKIEQFQTMEIPGYLKYMRTRVLLFKIEGGKTFKKLLDLWVRGIFGWLNKYFQSDTSMELLSEKELERVYYDTGQNYLKNTLKEINRSMKSEFMKAGYYYRPVKLEDKTEYQWSRWRPQTKQGKFWLYASRFFTYSKLPSIFGVLFSAFTTITAGIVYLSNWLSDLLQKALMIPLLVSFGIHFLSGVTHVGRVFTQWQEEVAKQLKELSQKDEIDSGALGEQWLGDIKEKVYTQIDTPKGFPWKKVATITLVLAIIGTYSYYNWPYSESAGNSIVGEVEPLNSNNEELLEEPIFEPPVIEILDKSDLLNRMQKWGKITVLSLSGSDIVLERSIPKKIFGGTIPTTDLQIKVTYNYNTDYILDLEELTEADLEIEGESVKVSLSKPKIDGINITHDRKEMSGAVFANNGTPEEELEEFEPGYLSYKEILRKNVEDILVKDQGLQNKIMLEAKKQIETRLLDVEDRISEVEVILVEVDNY